MTLRGRNTIEDHELRRTAATWAASGKNISDTARQLGIARQTVQSRIRLAKSRGLVSSTGLTQDLHIDPAPDADEPIEELLARKKSRLTRERAAQQWANLIPVQVTEARPIAVCLVGDPHVDDDGCDIHQLEHDLSTVGKTPGMYAGHVGDLTNNWVGRLARLYAHQSTSFRDSLRLTEWMLGLCRNLFLVGGNHDTWSQGMDLVRFIARQTTTGPLQAHGARLALRWPDGGEIRIHCRHDFPGKSQFSDTHGMKRELLWGHRDHILVAGHLHVDEARIEPSLDGEAHWMFRVSGYKVLDEYAAANHLRPKRLAPSVSVVLDPSQSVPAERVKPFWSVEAAADYLSFVRRRK